MSDVVPSEGSRASVVFAVTAVGAFMAALDLSIVNVAFPDLEASYPSAIQAALAWVITACDTLPHALCTTFSGGPSGAAYLSPHSRMAVSTGQRSRPLRVSRYS